MSSKRIMKELEDTRNDKNSGVTLTLRNDNDLTKLIGTFLGPPDSPYEGGKFVVDIEVPMEYPFKPPKMKFITKVYHPNVSSQTGAICLDILKDAWTPILSLKSSLISLQALLQSPEPNDPQDAVVANVYINDKKKFEETARQWTKLYANNEEEFDETFGIDAELIQVFENMGFSKTKIVDVLRDVDVKSKDSLSPEMEDRIIQRLCG